MQEKNEIKLDRARKRVKRIKGFYSHLLWYIIINLALLVIEFRVYEYFNVEISLNRGFNNWVNYNFIVTPVIWGIGLAFHGLSVFRHKYRFFDAWEKRQIEKYMQEGNDSKWE